MLDPWIIEEIRRREDERRREREACRIELPIHNDEPLDRPPFERAAEDRPKRGVVVIDI